jgi:hypothetical protein
VRDGSMMLPSSVRCGVGARRSWACVTKRGSSRCSLWRGDIILLALRWDDVIAPMRWAATFRQRVTQVTLGPEQATEIAQGCCAANGEYCRCTWGLFKLGAAHGWSEPIDARRGGRRRAGATIVSA